VFYGGLDLIVIDQASIICNNLEVSKSRKLYKDH
jgi:hypothetical protein